MSNGKPPAGPAPDLPPPDPPPHLSPDLSPGAGRPVPAVPARPAEIGGRTGPDPTRYGDWELNGRCIDF